MVIDYPAGKQYALRVRDTEQLDHFVVFVNHLIRGRVVDDELHEFPIERPQQGAIAVAVHFEGIDGGDSAIVDITDNPGDPPMVSTLSGLIHSYILKAAE